MSDRGLTQDDFRLMLETPRRPVPNEQDKESGPSKTGSNGSAPLFATPAALRRKQRFVMPQPRQVEEEEEEESDRPKAVYRDRAAERRRAEALEDQGETDTTESVNVDLAQLEQKKQQLKKALAQLPTKTNSQPSEESQHEDAAQEMEADNALDDTFAKIERGERLESESHLSTDKDDMESIVVRSLMAKNIVDLLRKKRPVRLDHFAPGRMAFAFELADDAGKFSQAFSIPTAIVRSKTAGEEKVYEGGWTDASLQSTGLVIDKLIQVMTRSATPPPMSSVVDSGVSEPAAAEAEVAEGSDVDMFGEDDGEDFVLPSKLPPKRSLYTVLPNTTTVKDDVTESDTQAEVNRLLSQATGEGKITGFNRPTSTSTSGNTAPRPWETMDEDANDIDMFGLSTSALPSSLDEMAGRLSQLDEDSSQRKRPQLTRADFDNDAAWERYQAAAEQSERKRQRAQNRRNLSDKQKLSREYHMVKQVMKDKYGQSL